MIWRWDHCDRSYRNAKANLSDLCHETLAVISAEIKACRVSSSQKNELDEPKYQKELIMAREISSLSLIDLIWESMNSYRLCDEGGFNAYCCPYGCHTVSFDRKEDTDE